MHTPLHTPRLTLRRPVAADAESIFSRYASDPRVTRFMAWPTHRSIADTGAFLEFCDAQWERGPAGSYLIVRSTDNLLLGATGLDCETPARAETGYVLARDAWDQGYATEALVAMVTLARTLGVLELSAGVHPDHPASIRVLEKGGFRLLERWPRTTGFPNLEPGLTQDLLVYGRAP
jgi:RimJ/RimL family protein N-acetyltransferase